MGEALYRKYRSRGLDEVVGQQHITNTLKNALKNGNISHSYLFTGPRGVGKTSVARIWAREINSLSYSESINHLDIIEIDAASNRRIDEIRDLRDKVQLVPSSAKYKVYIIDEVHMLTKEAFNALLKTLEEPPKHAVFILATTEAHKLPETIVSRTQRFTFKPIEENIAIEHLRFIATKENIKIDDPSLKIIAQHGDGSFRDSIGFLDQISSSTNSQISITSTEELLGIVPSDIIEELCLAIMNGNNDSISTLLSQLSSNNSTPQQIAKQLNSNLRKKISLGVNLSKGVFQLMDDLINVPASHDPDTSLMLALLKPTSEGFVHTATNKNDTINYIEPALSISPIQSESTEMWPKVLAEIKKNYNTLYSVLRMAKPSIGKNTINLEFNFGFHQKRINEMKNQKIINDIVHKLTGNDFMITTTVVAQNKLASPIKKDLTLSKKSEVQNISNIFGSAEVLES